jgi:hypothetical protein
LVVSYSGSVVFAENIGEPERLIMEQDRCSPAAEPLRKYRHLPAAGCFLAGVCAAILGVGVFGYQCLLWLRDGFWTPLEFALVMPEPHFIRLVGLQKIMDALWGHH